MITGLYFAKENRIFGMFPSLIREYKKKSHERYDMGLEMVNTQIKAGAVNTVLSTIQNFGVYAYLIYRVVRNKILVGNLTIYIRNRSVLGRSRLRHVIVSRDRTTESVRSRHDEFHESAFAPERYGKTEA